MPHSFHSALLTNTFLWQSSSTDILNRLNTSESGLSEDEAIKRQKLYGLNRIHKKTISMPEILFRQVTSNPLILILVIATGISYLLGQHISSYYIFGVIIMSIILGLWNEYSAEKTIENLLKKISPTALVLRNNEKIEIPVAQLTIGDMVLLSQGSIIPADLRIIETKNLEVNESILTGEAKTIYKISDPLVKPTTSINELSNIGFMGTSVESGGAKGIVIQIGKQTEFGKIAQESTYVRPITEFQKGLATFGNLILKIIILMTIAIFLLDALVGHTLIDSLLFSLAIAVGLTPELLPVIVTINLAHGAGKLAKKHVVAKRLITIESLGNMDILCTDKTGTLTEGIIDVVNYVDKAGKKNDEILKLSLICNSAIIHHKSIGNAIDTAIWNYALRNNVHIKTLIQKLDEEPFDYKRKAMFTVISENDEQILIVKGATDTVISLCNNSIDKKKLHKKIIDLNNEGFRIIAVATKKLPKKTSYSWDDARELEFKGYLTFLDFPKKSAKEALIKLKSLHVITKIITGDNEIVTQKVCKEVGIEIKKIMLGSEMDTLSDEELKKKVFSIDIFAKITPEQKLRIIQALQKLGHTVGYLGDGINDIPSLHGADVGISVNSAIDVAKDAAAIVLLRKSLEVIADGVEEGRKTFNNTIKYILMSSSSNFGNMFSAAGASFFLPFLPMTPVQILITNGLYDISQMSIPTDTVDRESLIKPRHFNINFIKNYMIFFGPLSSLFDLATFSIMIFLFHAKNSLFQTGWFIESIITEIFVVFIIRTQKTPFFLSRPSNWLLVTCLSMAGIGIVLPFTPLAPQLGFVVPPPLYFVILILLTILYLTLVEVVKNIFLKRYSL